LLDFEKEPLALYNSDVAHDCQATADLQLASNERMSSFSARPDYHGGISGAMKNSSITSGVSLAGKLLPPLSPLKKGLP